MYYNQFKRVRRELNKADLNDIINILANMFGQEAGIVKAEILPFYDALTHDVSAAALREISAGADPEALQPAIIRLANRLSQTFAQQMSDNSLNIMYGMVEDWRTTPGANKGDLIERMERIWTGPRPAAAATTETTRLVAETRHESWVQSGIVAGYEIVTKNDDRVRSRHREIAAAGPYRIDDLDHLPPFGDVNCRCTAVPVLIGSNPRLEVKSMLNLYNENVAVSNNYYGVERSVALAYVESLKNHIANVQEAGRRIGVDENQLLIHDLSKWGPEEFPAYAIRFHGSGDNEEDFKRAWLHHLHYNPHHWDHWLLPSKDKSALEPLFMPDNFALEMVADWMGAGKSYQGTWDMSAWLENNYPRIRPMLHKDTAVYVDNVLAGLGYQI